MLQNYFLPHFTTDKFLANGDTPNVNIMLIFQREEMQKTCFKPKSKISFSSPYTWTDNVVKLKMEIFRKNKKISFLNFAEFQK